MDVWSKNMKEYNFILLYATDLIYFYLISKNFVWTENITQQPYYQLLTILITLGLLFKNWRQI